MNGLHEDDFSQRQLGNDLLLTDEFVILPVCSPQHAGFNHVHRTSMAVRPHCVFDVVVPFHNSSKEARIPGEFCIPEHVTGGAAVGDYDGDGMEDIYFTVFDGQSVLYRNNGET